MTGQRITIKELRITNGELEPAILNFQPGLNLLVGASDTGKTFVFEAIDFMLGAKEGLRRFPISKGYERISMQIDPSKGCPFTLERAMNGGAFKLTEFCDGRTNPATATNSLSNQHSPEPRSSVSSYLLGLIGIASRQVRKNALGAKVALTFRHVAHLVLVDEERIIQQSSPLLTEGNHIAHTAEANVFGYFLTGLDDSAIIQQESSTQRKLRLAAEASVLEALIEEKEEELLSLISDPTDLAEQVSKLDSSLNDATQVIYTTQAKIESLEGTREQFMLEKVQSESKALFLREQLKRLQLLDDYYTNDKARIESVVEASRVIHDLPEGTCPMCKQPLAEKLSPEPIHEQFDAACYREIEKIDQLRTDLKDTVVDFMRELDTISVRLTDLRTSLFAIDREVQSTLLPLNNAAQLDLRELMKIRMSLVNALSLKANLEGLSGRLELVTIALSDRVSTPTFEKRVTTSSANDFCKIVESILRDWKYPDVDTVAFDTEKQDLVIGGQDRANKGKGYRAITYAAFTIGLMKYCRQNSIPHPGIVVLDTPLNPYKGPTASGEDEEVEDSVKSAFFEYLANDSSGDQFIIMENEMPNISIQSRSQFIEFTRNPSFGRYGFSRPDQRCLIC